MEVTGKWGGLAEQDFSISKETLNPVNHINVIRCIVLEGGNRWGKVLA